MPNSKHKYYDSEGEKYKSSHKRNDTAEIKNQNEKEKITDSVVRKCVRRSQLVKERDCNILVLDYPL